MKETITCCYIGCGMKPLAIEVPKDDALRSLQEWVQGDVEVLDVRSDGIELWVNDGGLVNNMPPNMAVYADKGMEDEGFLSQIDYDSVVKDGDLYTVLVGPIVAARSDNEGNLVDLRPEDIARLQEERPDSRRAVEEITRMRCGLAPMRRDEEPRPSAIAHRFWPDPIDLMPTVDDMARDVPVGRDPHARPSTAETLAALDKAATKIPQATDQVTRDKGIFH